MAYMMSVPTQPIEMIVVSRRITGICWADKEQKERRKNTIIKSDMVELTLAI